MSQNFNPEILAFIDRLAEVGSNYRIAEMEPLYAEDLSLLALTPDGGVMRINKAEMLDEFRARRDAGEPPLSTEMRVLHVEERGGEATALLYRRMSDASAALVHELRLKKIGGDWHVTGETIAPWPDLSSSQGFLPPRSNRGRTD